MGEERISKVFSVQCDISKIGINCLVQRLVKGNVINHNISDIKAIHMLSGNTGGWLSADRTEFTLPQNEGFCIIKELPKRTLTCGVEHLTGTWKYAEL